MKRLIFAVMVMVGYRGIANAQSASNGRCIVDFEGSPTTHSNLIQLPTGKYDAYVGGGFIGHCRGQQVTLLSDSAEYYGDNSLLYLIGNVHYIEPRAKIDAKHMTYWTAEGHVRADSDVYAVMSNGTTMRGPNADYYRIVPGVRTQTMLIATGRPLLGIAQRDSITGKVSDTVHVLADHLMSVADSLTYAGGDVHITRPDLLATGDSAFMDNGSGRARLIGIHGTPTVEARHSRPFTLTGGIIDVFSTNRQADRIVATPHGHATSQDFQLYADSIDLRVHANVLQRAMAWGKSETCPIASDHNLAAEKTQACAISPDRGIYADSIDAILPDQRIRELRAVRRAYATSVPDTVTITTPERDWMRGDTIVTNFDTLTIGDTSKTPPVHSLVAYTDAHAYYHTKNGATKSNPGANYVIGNTINIMFLDRAVQTVTVVGKVSGVYLDPTDSTKTRTQPTTPSAGRRSR